MLFIHQYPDWTNFRYSRTAILDPLCRIRFLQGTLQGKISFAKDPSFLESVKSRDLNALFKIADREEIPQVIYPALRNFSSPMNEKRLLSLHAAIINNGGHYRETLDSPQIEAFHGFRGVSWERIPQEMEKFFTFFNESQLDGIFKAGIVHFWFGTIRPFSSGNGILSRLLCDMMISRSENSSQRFFSLNEEILKDKSGYFEALSMAERSNGDITEWILWFLSKIEAALETAKAEWAERFEAARQEIFLGKISLTDREQNLVRHLREKPGQKISSSQWAEISKISHDSALRDLNNLVQKGVLIKSSGKGRSTKYGLKDISP